MMKHQQNEQDLPGPLPLPFSPERMERLLDKALDWIGECESGRDLYDTLKTQVGMTDEEILAAGFGTLEGYFEESDESESPGMTMR